MEKSIKIDGSKCDFCGTCVGACSEDAIELKESVICVIQDRCTLCCDCIVICPLGVPELVE